jgi:hypothetical protein
VSADISLWQATVYGVVQGLTEFLPISSTAHVRILQAWLNPEVSQPGFTAFTAVIQLGTMAAVVLFFWRELLHVTVAWLRGLVDSRVRGTLEYRMGWYLILATIPVGVLGLVFKHQITTGARNLWLIAVNAAPGSSQPASEPTIRRWALEEIGRNSVSPCTRPRTTASNHDTGRHPRRRDWETPRSAGRPAAPSPWFEPSRVVAPARR